MPLFLTVLQPSFASDYVWFQIPTKPYTVPIVEPWQSPTSKKTPTFAATVMTKPTSENVLSPTLTSFSLNFYSEPVFPQNSAWKKVNSNSSLVNIYHIYLFLNSVQTFIANIKIHIAMFVAKIFAAITTISHTSAIFEIIIEKVM